MRRVLLLAITCAVVAFTGWYIWNLSHETWALPVSALLPRETIFLAQMPDFNRTRDQWHHSDIYALYQEPAVQDFLRKPLANLSKADAVGQTLREIEQLDPKNVFLALTSIEGNSPTFVGGFRFRGRPDDAERVVGKWRSQVLEKNPGTKREKIKHGRHEIELLVASPFTLATAYDRPWFLAATDLAELKALLERADHHGNHRNDALTQNEAYRAAISHRPWDYALSFYLQPKTFAQRLAALRASVQSAATAKESTLLEQMRAIFGTTKFEGGKIHDVVFLGMPKLDEDATLSRSSPRLGTRETFFYLAMLLNVGGKVDTLNQAAGFSGAMQRIFQAFTDGGITADDWKAAFGTEVESVADWPSSAHWPTLLVTLPVLDMAKAGNIVEAVTRADEAAWTKTEKDGVRYFSKQSPANLVAVTPTIALSDRILIVALNPVSAEEAVKRSVGASSELADSQTYKAATRLLPPPTNFFAYVDTALLYSRLDASLRPILMLAAAFMPSVATDFDLAKIPSLEVITKHLSPIVTSQRYDRDGYVVESIGPITLDQSLSGLAIAGGLGTMPRQISGSGKRGWGSSPAVSPQPSPSPSGTP
ncbi:MAG: hypothetical protein DME54_14810 [Verrucomicrobia bacterium]|nr:MAG: hypothetical protein DME54_14810 [Verrucomicrobiota bacterium]